MSDYKQSMSDDERRALDASLQEYENRGITAQARAATSTLVYRDAV